MKKADTEVTLDFRVYEQLPAAGNAALLDLRLAHPDARVDANADDFPAAEARLLPHG